MRSTPIDDAWRSYLARVLPADAPEVQRLECRRAFFAGAMALWSDLNRKVSPGDAITDADLGLAVAIDAELRAFGAQVGTPAESPAYAAAAAPPQSSGHDPAADCLHCRISAAIAPAMGRQSVNDVLGHVAEVVGELLAGVGDRNARRQLLRGTTDEAWRHAGEVRRSRVEAGVPDLEVRRHRIH